MAVMGVWAFILCTRHRWHIKQKNKKPRKHTKEIFPEQKTKKYFVLHHLCPVHEILTGIWNPLISGQIVNSFGQGKCTFDCQSGNLKNLCLWQPCLNKLMHVENWNTHHFQHYLYVNPRPTTFSYTRFTKCVEKVPWENSITLEWNSFIIGF